MHLGNKINPTFSAQQIVLIFHTAVECLIEMIGNSLFLHVFTTFFVGLRQDFEGGSSLHPDEDAV